MKTNRATGKKTVKKKITASQKLLLELHFKQFELTLKQIELTAELIAVHALFEQGEKNIALVEKRLKIKK